MNLAACLALVNFFTAVPKRQLIQARFCEIDSAFHYFPSTVVENMLVSFHGGRRTKLAKKAPFASINVEPTMLVYRSQWRDAKVAENHRLLCESVLGAFDVLAKCFQSFLAAAGQILIFVVKAFEHVL